MIYVLILTTYLFGTSDRDPMAVTQTAIPGFSSKESCEQEGKIAQAGTPNLPSTNQVIVIYQCAKVER